MRLDLLSMLVGAGLGELAVVVALIWRIWRRPAPALPHPREVLWGEVVRAYRAVRDCPADPDMLTGAQSYYHAMLAAYAIVIRHPGVPADLRSAVELAAAVELASGGER